MKSPSRIFVSFVILFDILVFGLNFLTLANGARADDLLFIADSDGARMIAFSLIGVVLNIALGIVLWRGRLYTRRTIDIDASRDRPRITGE